jgi:hypothetical protein
MAMKKKEKKKIMKNLSVASLSFSKRKNNSGVKLPPTQSLNKPRKRERPPLG